MSRVRIAGRTVKFEGGCGSLVATAYGEPTGWPVLLLHGGGQTRHAWGRTGEALAQAGAWAVCVDARGHGDSDWSTEGHYLIDDFVMDLALLVDQIEASPAIGAPAVVGASLGGWTAMLYEGERGPKLSAVIPVDIAATVQKAGIERVVSFMLEHGDGFPSLRDVADAVAAYLPHRKPPSNLNGLRKNVRLLDGRYYWHWDPKFMEDRRARYRQSGHLDMAQRLPQATSQIRVPTLLVRGKRSDVVGPEDVKRFLELVPHAEFVDVGDAGHMVAGDSNDPFSDAVMGFLVRHRLSR